MTPDDIKQARVALKCTAKELAAALGVEPATVAAWERGEMFPTKQYVVKLQELLAQGPAAIPKKAKGDGPFEALRDPDVWTLIRKILAHPKLRAEVARLAARYDEP
ncbi:MAG: helix-turn-helix transcriptional regulator [Deltaproteobacteria bacterium]|nr:helix-turn-helix transcriptional regulator [Deltaproteobacteria bacterium]